VNTLGSLFNLCCTLANRGELGEHYIGSRSGFMAHTEMTFRTCPFGGFGSVPTPQLHNPSCPSGRNFLDAFMNQLIRVTFWTRQSGMRGEPSEPSNMDLPIRDDFTGDLTFRTFQYGPSNPGGYLLGFFHLDLSKSQALKQDTTSHALKQ